MTEQHARIHFEFDIANRNDRRLLGFCGVDVPSGIRVTNTHELGRGHLVGRPNRMCAQPIQLGQLSVGRLDQDNPAAAGEDRLGGIGRNQAYEAARRGEIPTIRIGKRILVPVAALDRLLSVNAA